MYVQSQKALTAETTETDAVCVNVYREQFLPSYAKPTMMSEHYRETVKETDI